MRTKEPNRRMEHEERVLRAANTYSFTLFRGTAGWFRGDGFANEAEAIEAAAKCVEDVEFNPGARPANIYAIATELHEHFVLVGTVYRNKGYRPAIRK